MPEPVRVPVTILSGALGVGKTTVVRDLLARIDEAGPPRRIAVLVNEFGEVGIDAALVHGASSEVAVRELAGGCLCCTLGLPMVVAVTQLLARARPQHLLIEMSGLGHAGGLVETLAAPPLSEHVVVTRVVTLVDPRAWTAGKLDREPFASQIEAADVIVLHKVDLASREEIELARRRAEQAWPPKEAVLEVSRGAVDLHWLLDERAEGSRRSAPCTSSVDEADGHAHEDPSDPRRAKRHAHVHGHHHERGEHGEPGDRGERGDAGETPSDPLHLRHHGDGRDVPGSILPQRPAGCSSSSAAPPAVNVGRGEGYVTFGVQLPASHLIHPGAFRAWMEGLPPGARLKAVLRLGHRDDTGAVRRLRWVSLQVADGEVDERDSAWRKDSRLEVLVPVDAFALEVEADFVSRLRIAMQDSARR